MAPSDGGGFTRHCKAIMFICCSSLCSFSFCTSVVIDPINLDSDGASIKPHIDREVPCTPKYCRPSFLIIGAGKSGTSSLYYYLQDHPQVEGAKMKQVQFFDHQFSKGADWYYQKNFPKQMEEGHITGEASPGYMVYSNVPGRVFSMLPKVNIIAILREPIDRIWSSYHYNYVDVLRLRRSTTPAGLDSFVEVERKMLGECFEKRQYDARSGSSGDTNPVDFVKHCFEGFSQDSQLKKIRKSHKRSGRAGVPDFPQTNPHLYRQFVSRGLYSLMLEHWYEQFPANQISVLCTESLSVSESGVDLATEQLSRVASFIGVGEFDFTETVSKGKFNAAENKGYGKVTSWDAESKQSTPEMPADLHDTLKEFYRPFNERLFELTNNRCQWPL